MKNTHQFLYFTQGLCCGTTNYMSRRERGLDEPQQVDSVRNPGRGDGSSDSEALASQKRQERKALGGPKKNRAKARR